jgi:hypothetical protein
VRFGWPAFAGQCCGAFAGGLGSVVWWAEPLQLVVAAFAVDVIGVAGFGVTGLVQWCDGGASGAVGQPLASALCLPVAGGSSCVPVSG